MLLDTFTESLWPHLSVTSKTKQNYQGAYRRYVKGPIGSLELSEITKGQVVELLAILPPQSRYQTLMMLKTVYREAIDREIVESSPVATIKAPRVSPKPAKFLTWEQIDANDFGRQNERIRFLALHGLRWGEAAALTQDDIRDGFVHITKSIYGATKSKAGVRKVPYLGHFDPFPKTQLTVAQALSPYGVNVHSLRKTYAYSLKTSNVHVTTAQKLLGHSSPLVTMQIYTAVLDDEIGKSAELLINNLKLKPVA